MNYYIDGNFKELSILKGEDRLFSSIYSSKETNHELVNPDKSIMAMISEKVFYDLVDFYNTYDSFFLKFEKKIGFNPWFLEQSRLYYRSRNYLLKIASIETFLQMHKDGRIITADKRLLAFFPVDKIQFEKPAKGKSIFNLKRFVAELFYLFSQLKFKESGKSNVLLLPKIAGNSVESDARFGLLNKAYDQSVIREIFNLKIELPTKKFDKFSRFNSDQIFLNYLLSFKWVYQLIHFRKAYNRLIEELNIENLSPIFSLIKSLFLNGAATLPIYFLRYQSFNSYFSKRSIKGIVLSDENSPQQKVIQYAASKYQIKSFALQHGIITEYHLAYNFKRYKQQPILPDITFTWGESFSRILIEKGAYPEKQVKTVGKVKPLKSAALENNLKLPDKRKVILYASQPQPDENLRKLHLQDVLKAAQKLIKTYQLIIRPHPAEKEDNYFIEIANELGFLEFIIDRKSSLEWHFEISEILITAYSTVGAEYTPFLKPLLVLDYLNQDIVNYIKEGIGIHVRSGEELLKLLSQEQLLINESAYQKFITNYFYKPDGMAAERIREHIEQTLKH